MTDTELLIQKVQSLSPDDQAKLLAIIVALPSVQEKEAAPEEKSRPQSPRPKTLLGRFAYRGLHITGEDIAEARQGMWANFPRAFPDPKQNAS